MDSTKRKIEVKNNMEIFKQILNTPWKVFKQEYLKYTPIEFGERLF